MTTHYIKVKNKTFWDIHMLKRNVEITENDRDFKEGDTVVFTYWDKRSNQELEKYTEITYVYGNYKDALKDGYTMFSFKAVPKKTWTAFAFYVPSYANDYHDIAFEELKTLDEAPKGKLHAYFYNKKAVDMGIISKEEAFKIMTAQRSKNDSLYKSYSEKEYQNLLKKLLYADMPLFELDDYKNDKVHIVDSIDSFEEYYGFEIMTEEEAKEKPYLSRSLKEDMKIQVFDEYDKEVELGGI